MLPTAEFYDGAFDKIWIQLAAGDAGGALGSSGRLLLFEGKDRAPSTGRDHMVGSYLGPAFSQEEIEDRLRQIGAKFLVVDEVTLISQTVQALAKEMAVGCSKGGWNLDRAH